MIPYPTVEDASVALGRNLTWFETVWFDYSATKSNFHVYCHTILVLFLVFSLAPFPLVIVEWTGWFDQFKIQKKVKYSLSDMFQCYKEVMKLFLLVVGTLQIVSYPSIQVTIHFKFSFIL
jgi:4,4-dimethyl-9beta,19-cyclopropylsterol-4alpha-methyl oxidase